MTRGLTFLFLVATFPLTADEPPVYERDIAPILRSACAGCHNDREREAQLSVETYAQLRRGGEDHGDPVVPGDPEASFVIRALTGTAKPKMPPKDEPQPTAGDVAMLRRWIAAGAPGPERDESILRTLTVPEFTPATSGLPVTAACVSPDGRTLVVAQGGRLEWRDAVYGQAVRRTDGLPGKVNALHFSPGGTQLVVAGGIPGLRGVAQLRDAATGAVVRSFEGHADVLSDAELSPDGRTLATAGYDRRILLWSTEDGRELRRIHVHKGAVTDLAWHPSGRVLASASADETVKLWRVADGVRLDTLNQPQGELNAVLFTPDGRHVIAAGRDRRLHVWQFVSGSEPALNPVLHSRFAHESAITALALGADGRTLVSTAEDRSLKRWRVPDLAPEAEAETQPDVVSTLVPLADGSFLAARLDGSVAAVAFAPVAATREENVASISEPAVSPPAGVSEVTEDAPNDTPQTAVALTVPAVVRGRIERGGDADHFRFRAAAGERLTLEVNAARAKSPLDSRLEVLHADGSPVEQVVLQAVRDSWFTFRGKDSTTSDDFRLHNWAEMELNEYLWANGEVVKLWLYPRGPDSGFKVYPGTGERHTFFGTPALVHALGEPAWIVAPLPAGSQPVPNGLPVFRVFWENDDEPTRRLGADSQIVFTAPAAGDYVVRVTDVRGFGGEDFAYTLNVRTAQPGFTARVEGGAPAVSPGSASELAVAVERREGFDGPVQLEFGNVPAGFALSGPVEIEAGQERALAVVSAAADAVAPPAGHEITVKATARVDGRDVVQDLPPVTGLKLREAPKVTVQILPGADRSCVVEAPGQPLEFRIRPGQTIGARVKAERRGFTGRIELGNEDSGRNLPHGLYVDNIGLNGLLIVEGQDEREFFITAAKIARPGERLFHLRTTADGGQASTPVVVRVEAVPTVSQQR